MFRTSFLTCIALLPITLQSSLSVSDDKNTPVDALAVSVTEAANADDISNNDLAIRYSVYRGTYLYGTKFNFEESTDFGLIFDKQRKIANKLDPNREKGTKLSNLLNSTFKKYEDEKIARKSEGFFKIVKQKIIWTCQNLRDYCINY